MESRVTTAQAYALCDSHDLSEGLQHCCYPALSQEPRLPRPR